MDEQEKVLYEKPGIVHVSAGESYVTIMTHHRTATDNTALLSNEEATQVAFAILLEAFDRKGLKLANAPLLTCARLLDVDPEKLP